MMVWVGALGFSRIKLKKNTNNGMEAGVACGAEEFYMVLRIMYIVHMYMSVYICMKQNNKAFL